jgi:hypothetical protein
LTLTAEEGKIHGFTTMTVNPRCPEILDQLLPGQIAFDRPDIVNRIFHAKKKQL